MKTWQVSSDDTRSGLMKWADGLYEAFVRLEPQPTTHQGFSGQIRQAAVADLSVSIVTSSGHEVRRLREHIAHRASDTIFVNVLSRGRSLVRQAEAYQVAPMDVSILDTRRPFSIRHDAPFQLASLALPSDWLDPEIRGHFALSRSTSGRELSRVLWGLSKAILATGTGQTGARTALAEQLRNSLALIPVLDGGDERAHSAEILQSYVRHHLDQPDLRAETLARHFGLSVRRVHQLFAPTGKTVSDFINDTRLDQAAELLGAPDAAQRSISHIAWTVGYSDPAYFSRRFRRKFGCSPRAYREDRQPGSIAH